MGTVPKDPKVTSPNDTNRAVPTVPEVTSPNDTKRAVPKDPKVTVPNLMAKVPMDPLWLPLPHPHRSHRGSSLSHMGLSPPWYGAMRFGVRVGAGVGLWGCDWGCRVRVGVGVKIGMIGLGLDYKVGV